MTLRYPWFFLRVVLHVLPHRKGTGGPPYHRVGFVGFFGIRLRRSRLRRFRSHDATTLTHGHRADPHVVRAAAPHCSALVPQSSVPQLGSAGVVPGTRRRLPELWAMVRKFDISRFRTYTICTVVCRTRNVWTMVRKFGISRFREYSVGTARKSTFWVRNFLWRIALSCGEST